MARDSGSIAFCSDDANLEKFSLISASFGQAAFSPTYDPWAYVDSFERFKINKSLHSSHRAKLLGPKKTSTRSATDDSVVDESAVKPLSDSERRRLDRSDSRSATSSVVAEYVPRSSNSLMYICIYVRPNCKLVHFFVYLHCLVLCCFLFIHLFIVDLSNRCN